ncbi:MAG: NarL family signal transduction histidine kinase [Chlorobi bacterium OLB6]|nr:MAG: NarL family signal transduction histidine kinase [Chlorobi bacterium OLB6]MBW7852793.1 ATP-binding protein [Candidatus Kapabacteria bacterium]MCC6330969.1 ATP-binding protein [Ignavibacteria bacterium]
MLSFGIIRVIRYTIVAACVVFMLSCTAETDDTGEVWDHTHVNEQLDSANQLYYTGELVQALQVLKTVQEHWPLSLPKDVRQRYYFLVTRVLFDAEAYAQCIDAGMVYAHDPMLPGFASPHRQTLFVAHALKKAGDYSMALVWYRASLLTNPHVMKRDVYGNLATLFTELRQYDSALVYVRSVDSMHALEKNWDENAVVWYRFLAARCHAGLGDRDIAIAELNRGITYAEQHRLSFDQIQVGVRLTLYERLLRDSVNMKRIGSAWEPLSKRLRRLLQLDSHEIKNLVPIRDTVRKNIQNVDTFFLNDVESQRADRLPASASWLITGSVVDRYGWQWVATLQGLFLRVGPQLCAVQMPNTSRLYAIADITIASDTLVLQRYDGSADKVAIDDLRLPPRISGQLPRNNPVEWSRRHLLRQPVTGLTELQNEKIVYFYNNKYGVGSLESEPLSIFPIRMNARQSWQGIVNCGISESDSVLLVGTDRGLWRLNIFTGNIDSVYLHNSIIEGTPIRQIHRLDRRRLQVDFSFGASCVFQIDEKGTIMWQNGTVTVPVWSTDVTAHSELPVHRLLIEDRMNAAEVVVHERTNSVPPLTVQNQYLTSLLLGDTLRTLFGGRWLALYNRVDTSVTVKTIPNTAGIREQMVSTAALTRNSAIVMTDSLGITVGRIKPSQPSPGSLICAYSTPGSNGYSISADGFSISLPAHSRTCSIILGKESSFGSLQIPITITRSWDDSVLSYTTGDVVQLNNIPPGKHTLRMRSGDNTVPFLATIEADAFITETLWFRGVLILLLLSLVFASVKYIMVRRQNKKNMMKLAILEERIQIGRDLHDALGADLVRINMLTHADPTETVMSDISAVTREANRTLRDIIWSVSEVYTLDAVAARLIERTRTSLQEAGISFQLDSVTSIPQVPQTPQQLRDLALIVTEAVTNAIKHSRATNMLMRITVEPHDVTISLSDNGIGFDTHAVKRGVGLNSMAYRAERSGFILNQESVKGRGTTVSLHISLKQP